MKITLLTAFSIFLLVSFSNAQVTPQLNEPVSSSDEKSDIKPEEPAKRNVSNKAYVVQTRTFQNDVARLEEGYTAFEGGGYAIKDYLLKGTVNLICLTYSVSFNSSGNMTGGDFSKRYFVQRNGSIYYEVFLNGAGTFKVPKMLIGAPQTLHGIRNNKKSKASMLGISKATLSEVFKDDKATLEEISKIEKLKVAGLKKIVRLYNSNTGS